MTCNLNAFRCCVQGSFHTIPIFFLVSGYLASISFQTDAEGLLRFFKNRFLRVMPPFIIGMILRYIQRKARDEDTNFVDDILLSHLWFLWALALIQSLAVPYCVMVSSCIFVL